MPSLLSKTLYLNQIMIRHMNWRKSVKIVLCILCLGIIMTSCQKKGCTDPEAINYYSKASKDDGSCITQIDLFLGVYSGESRCNSNFNNLPQTTTIIKPVVNSNNRIFIEKFPYFISEVVADISGNEITIGNQVAISEASGNNTFNISGQGRLINARIEIDLTIVQGSTTSNCGVILYKTM